jgi:integrase
MTDLDLRTVIPRTYGRSYSLSGPLRKALGGSALGRVGGFDHAQRVPNEARRPRQYLTSSEVKRLIDVSRKRGRYGARDALMILIAYRARASLSKRCGLTWDVAARSRRPHSIRSMTARVRC